jgi:hypothetical protein
VVTQLEGEGLEGGEGSDPARLAENDVSSEMAETDSM